MGPEVSFAELYERHYRQVFGLCRRLLGSADRAEDATQEVFMRAHRAFARYDAAQPFAAWVSAIASNYCVDLARRRAREKRLFGSESAEWAAEQASPESAPRTVLAELVAAERADEVKAAVDALPEKYRMPLVLAYYGESSYDDIAVTLGITRTHVGTLIFRARQVLRRTLRAPQGEQ
jgi:RNA polymerase sigma-70 factor (ECF subfamily)